MVYPRQNINPVKITVIKSYHKCMYQNRKMLMLQMFSRKKKMKLKKNFIKKGKSREGVN